MIRMINRVTGGDMWVSDERVEEYLRAGHKLAPPPAPAHPIRRENDLAKDAPAAGAKKTRKK